MAEIAGGNLFPWIGNLPLREITARVLLEPLRRVESKGLNETAVSLRTRRTCFHRSRRRAALARQGIVMSPTVDVRGAADLMKVHPKTVLDLIGTGALPAGRVGRAYVLLTKEVLSYVEHVTGRDTAERVAGRGRRLRKRACW